MSSAFASPLDGVHVPEELVDLGRVEVAHRGPDDLEAAGDALAAPSTKRDEDLRATRQEPAHGRHLPRVIFLARLHLLFEVALLADVGGEEHHAIDFARLATGRNSSTSASTPPCRS